MMARPGLPRPRSVSRQRHGSYPTSVPIPAIVPTRSGPFPGRSYRCYPEPTMHSKHNPDEPRTTLKSTEKEMKTDGKLPVRQGHERVSPLRVGPAPVFSSLATGNSILFP